MYRLCVVKPLEEIGLQLDILGGGGRGAAGKEGEGEVNFSADSYRLPLFLVSTHSRLVLRELKPAQIFRNLNFFSFIIILMVSSSKKKYES